MNMVLQGSSIWMALLTGFGLAAVYDCYRTLRFAVTGRAGHSGVWDFFFMVGCGLVTYLLALAVDFGAVRFYLLACEVIGCCVYLLTVAVVTRRAAAALHRIFRWFCKMADRILLRPLLACWKKLAKAGRSLVGFVGKKVKKGAKKRKNPLKSGMGLVYNQTVSVWKGKTGKEQVRRRYGKQRNQSHQGEKEKQKR